MKISSSPRIATVLLLAVMLACGGGSSTTTTNPPPPTTTLRQVAAAHNILAGAAADSPYLSDSGYAATLGTEYSQLQAENEMKFGLIHPSASTYDFTGGDALVAFAQAHTMVVRGHTLVWHNQVPAWVTSGNYTWQQLSTILQDHITTVAGHYAGKVFASTTNHVGEKAPDPSPVHRGDRNLPEYQATDIFRQCGELSNQLR